MHSKKYIIKPKDFNRIYYMSQEIQGNVSIIENFCKNYEDIDDFYKIIPLIKYTSKVSEKLYCEFINMIRIWI